MITFRDWTTVPSQYVAWRTDYDAVRRFLINTNVGMSAWLDTQWSTASAEADRRFDPDQHDAGLVAEIFEETVGLWPDDYFWQLSSAVVKDSCTLFEVFLEDLAHAVLSRHGGGLDTRGSEDSWRWPECRDFYADYLGITVTPPDVEAILWIRNKLTHLRSTLRTSAGMGDFTGHMTVLGVDGPATADELDIGLVDTKPYLAHGVALTQLQTLRMIDHLGEHIGAVATAVMPYTDGTAATPALTALRLGKPTVKHKRVLVRPTPTA